VLTVDSNSHKKTKKNTKKTVLKQQKNTIQKTCFFTSLVISALRWAVLTVLWIGFCHTAPVSLCV